MLYGLRDVCKMVGVQYHHLYYAFYTGRIPEPAKIGKVRLYTSAEVEAIKNYFAKNPPKKKVAMAV